MPQVPVLSLQLWRNWSSMWCVRSRDKHHIG
nr:MAG TPA: hypothetical protein [Caudoviricetes sp.]